MTDDLVKQLLDMARVDGCRVSIAAAEAIKALTAEREELVECNEQFSVDNQFLKKRVEKAEADNARLKAVLWKWLYWSVHNTGKETSHN
jgi:hypothetical protein